LHSWQTSLLSMGEKIAYASLNLVNWEYRFTVLSLRARSGAIVNVSF